MRRSLFSIFLFLQLSLLSAFAQVEASLVSREGGLVPGQKTVVALRLVHEAHWHTYWENPGTGLPTKLNWTLPAGISAGPIQWPTPEVITDRTGAVVGHGYSGELFLPLELSVDASVKPGTVLSLEAEASWLMCNESCVPGDTSLVLKLPVEATRTANTPWAASIEASLAAVPKEQNSYGLKAYSTEQSIVLDLTFPDGVALPAAKTGFHFFPADETLDYEKAQVVQAGPANSLRFILPYGLSAEAKKSTRLSGVLRSEAAWTGLSGAKGIPVELSLSRETPPPALAEPSAAPATGLPGTLLLAFVGGLILNLMPCVFPVLGIKILGFVQQAGAERRKVVMHGLAFSVGVLSSFWLLALGLFILRSGGAQLGWGFQLQSPTFVFVLALMLLAFGLNMSGLFEFGLSATAIGSDLQMKQGYSGSFFTGVLATLVATPCSAPFLAPALGAALTLPMFQSFLVFTSIAVGLSMPYLTLSIFPSLVKLLPRPGAWMESFRQAMAFPLFATVAFLLWVLVGQVDEGTFLNMMLGMVLCAFGLWDYGRHVQLARKPLKRLLGFARVLIVFGSGLWLAWPSTAKPGEELVWEPWSAERLTQLRNEQRLVYVDFTARWCATCQTNKKLVFSSDEVKRLIREKKVVLLRADWTRRDPLITAELARWERSAVPFNLVYQPGRADPVILPELLTPGIVEEALKP